MRPREPVDQFSVQTASTSVLSSQDTTNMHLHFHSFGEEEHTAAKVFAYSGHSELLSEILAS